IAGCARRHLPRVLSSRDACVAHRSFKEVTQASRLRGRGGQKDMKLRQSIFLSLILLIFAICLAWPILRVVHVGFEGIGPDGKPAGFTFAFVAAVFKDASLRRGLLNSFMIAILVTLVCFLISVPLALLSVRFDFRGKSLANALLL